MDMKHFEDKLVAKQAELKDTLARLESNARDIDNEEVKDSTDDATVSEGVSEALEESSVVSGTLEQVEAALARIKEGTYGQCLDCGKQIQPARLEAIPWAEYCIEDQEKHEIEENAPQGSTL